MMDEQTPYRRITDKDIADTDRDILRLIQSTADEHQKAILLVLYQINKSLVDNTKMAAAIIEEQANQSKVVNQHRKDFDKHIVDEMALFNRGLGAWKVLSIGAGMIAALTWYILLGYIGDLKEMKATNALQDLQIKKMETEIAAQQVTIEMNARELMELLIPPKTAAQPRRK